jgi:hypothetical protein
MERTRIAVLGLFRSGSTAVAGVLHHLGVDMGEPFFESFFESDWLARQLRSWWNEPYLLELFPQVERIRVLREWVHDRETNGSSHVGMKHPLLSLCTSDLLEAWGNKTRFIWAHRPIEDSIASLYRLTSWENPEIVQWTLWDALAEFFANQEHLRVEFSQMMRQPALEIERIALFVGLRPTEEQFQAATRFIVPEPNFTPAPNSVDDPL